MCGIVGCSGFKERALLSRMNTVQVHRGPDDSGEFWDGKELVGLAMRRLSIVDLQGGHQPMQSRQGALTIVFNGEIFNAPELRQELESKGVVFSTDHSDTEVILRLYDHIGIDCAKRLNGMFAFVIYDRVRRIIFGARDPFGIKPLYLHSHSKGIAWASELKALRELPGFSKQLDPVAVQEYLGLQYVPRERSIYSDAKKLCPGYSFIFDLQSKQLKTERFYELPFRSDGSGELLQPDDVRNLFADAVNRWAMADVPIACSLSGGVDSGAVVAALAHAGHSVKTYTLGFQQQDGADLNEVSLARTIAERYSTDHHEIIIDVDDLIGALPEMVWHLDEPYGGGLPAWYVFKAMSKNVKVAMTGVGGDELFSNYNKFQYVQKSRCFRQALALRDRCPGLSSSLGAASLALFKCKKMIKSYDPFEDVKRRHEREDAHLFWSHPFGLSYPTAHGYGYNERIVPGQGSRLSAGRLALERISAEYKHLAFRDRCAAVDFNNQLPDEFLQMTDRFSMAHSIEARTPFLDKMFVEKILGIPPDVRLNSQRQKALFKDAVAPWLPEGFTEHRKKGFVIPMARWLRGPLREQAESLFDKKSLKSDGYIRHDFKESHYRPFLEGQDCLVWSIWTVFMFRLWQEVQKKVST